MFLAGISAGALTTVSTTALHPVGALFFRPDSQITTAAHKGWGGQVWRYIKNGDSNSFLAGHLVARKTGATDETCVQMPATMVSRTYARGVAQHTIAASSFGWVLVRGAGLYLADTGGTTIDHVLIAGNEATSATRGFDSQANTTDEVSEGTQSYGIVITAATATNTGIGLFNQIGL